MLLIVLWTSDDLGKWNSFMESYFIVRELQKIFLGPLKICVVY